MKIVIDANRSLEVAVPTGDRYIKALKTLGLKPSDLHARVHNVEGKRLDEALIEASIDKQIMIEEKVIALYDSEESLIELCEAVFVQSVPLPKTLPLWAIVAGVLRFFRTHMNGLTKAFI